LSDFYIGQVEVTQELYQAYSYKDKNRLVENISWYDSKDFIAKLNALLKASGQLSTNQEFALP